MIYVNGDSWSRNLWISWSPEDWSWPKQLGESLNIEILNESQGCGSNSKIVADLQRNYFLGHNYDLVIIGLSSPNRWHIPARNMSSWLIGPTVLNDRLYKKDETILPWWTINSHNNLEYVYQHYSIIWQINEICKNYYKCPVLFFNAFDKKIPIIDEILQSGEAELSDWLKLNFESLFDNAYDDSWDKYVTAFNFFGLQRKNWAFDPVPWSSLLSPADIDGPNDRDPMHPSRHGHKIISDYVMPFVTNQISCKN